MSESGPTGSQFLVYQDEAGTTRIDVRFDSEKVGLTQTQLVEMFDSSEANISGHIKNVIGKGQLDAARTVRDSRTVRQDRTHKHYLSVRRRVFAEAQTKRRVPMTMAGRVAKLDGFPTAKAADEPPPGGQT